MIIYNINPVLLSIGPVEIRYYGLVYILALFLFYYLIIKKFDKFGFKDKNQAEAYAIIAFIVMFLCARFFAVFNTQPSFIYKDPLEFFRVWHGGMSFFGGLVGITLFSWIYCIKKKINFLKLADYLVILGAFMLFIGRFVNFINGEIVGTVTNVAWCVVFPGFEGCRHPYQIYSSIYHLILFGVLLWMYKLKQKLKWIHGYLLATFILVVCGLRFIFDFIKEDTRYLGLTVWQYFCIIGFFIGIYLLYWLIKNKKHKKKEKNIKKQEKIINTPIK